MTPGNPNPNPKSPGNPKSKTKTYQHAGLSYYVRYTYYLMSLN